MGKLMPPVQQFIMLPAEGGLIISKVNYCLVAMLLIKESAHCWTALAIILVIAFLTKWRQT